MPGIGAPQAGSQRAPCVAITQHIGDLITRYRNIRPYGGMVRRGGVVIELASASRAPLSSCGIHVRIGMGTAQYINRLAAIKYHVVQLIGGIGLESPAYGLYLAKAARPQPPHHACGRGMP